MMSTNKSKFLGGGEKDAGVMDSEDSMSFYNFLINIIWDLGLGPIPYPKLFHCI